MASFKVRRKRNKFHISAPKLNKLQDETNDTDDSLPLLQSITPIPNDFMNKLSFVSFSNTQAINGTREEEGMNKEKHVEKDDIQKEEGSGIFKKQMKKKDKRKLRHEKWMQKIEACQKAKEMAKAAMKRKRTVIVGDLQPLLSSLPEIDDNKIISNTETVALTSCKKKRKKKGGNTSISSAYKERELFQRVLSHPSYQSDPVGTISVHIKNTTSLNRI